MLDAAAAAAAAADTAMSAHHFNPSHSRVHERGAPQLSLPS